MDETSTVKAHPDETKAAGNIESDATSVGAAQLGASIDVARAEDISTTSSDVVSMNVKIEEVTTDSLSSTVNQKLLQPETPCNLPPAEMKVVNPNVEKSGTTAPKNTQEQIIAVNPSTAETGATAPKATASEITKQQMEIVEQCYEETHATALKAAAAENTQQQTQAAKPSATEADTAASKAANPENAQQQMQVVKASTATTNTATTKAANSESTQQHVQDVKASTEERSTAAAFDNTNKQHPVQVVKQSTEETDAANTQQKTVAAANVDKRTPRKSPKKKATTSVKRRLPNPYIKLAQHLLEDKIELAACLSQEDCTFLAINFWIFTVDQLAFYVEERPKEVTSGSGDKTPIPPSDVRDEFSKRVALVMSSSISEEPEAKKARVGEASISAAQSVTATAPSGVQKSDSTDEQQIGSDKESRLSTFSWLKEGNEPKESTQTSESDLLCGETMETTITPFSSMADPSTSGQTRKVPDSTMDQAKERIRKWKSAIQTFREEKEPRRSTITKSFPLDGAIQILFPQATMNFLKSLRIETTWDFMCLRRQENAPICAIMNQWRASCGAEKFISGYSISKHLCGVAARIEAALSSHPPVAKEVREWMDGPINCLSGAAREFVIHDQGIKSIQEFLEIRTKTLSLELESWRKRKGMETLKGSGKVAMVSSWKTFSRDVLELEAHVGSVIDLPMTVESHSGEEKAGEPVPKKAVPKRKSGRNPSAAKARNMMHSREFLTEVLGNNVAEALVSAGIQHGAELLEADMTPGTSVLYRTLIDGGIVDSISSFLGELSKWKTALTTVSAQRSKQKIVIQKEEDGDSPIEDPDSESEPPATPTKSIARRKRKTNPNVHEDPFEALSQTTKDFLRSVGVNTAEEFLSTRSTDLSLQFIKWRVAKGKPELKGCGAVASVSGWKTLVRKKAQNSGYDDIADLEPKDMRVRRMPTRNHSRSRITIPPPEEDFLTINRGPELASVVGKKFATDGREVFAVESHARLGKNFFELSRRGNFDEHDCERFFITYLGFSKDTTSCERGTTVSVDSGLGVSQLCILKKSKTAIDRVHLEKHLTFSSHHPCGGVIDVTAFQVQPNIHRNVEQVKHFISSFANGKTLGDLELSNSSTDSTFNVCNKKCAIDSFQHLLYLGGPLESGQTVEITHREIRACLSCDDRFHNAIESAISMLPVEAYGVLLPWIVQSAKSDGVNLAAKCIRNRRLYWTARRLSGISRLDTNGEFLLALSELCNISSIPEEQKSTYVDCVSKEIESEFLAFLHDDVRIGTVARRRWFPMAQEIFNETVSLLSQSQFTPVLEKLRDCFGSLSCTRVVDKLSFSCPKSMVSVPKSSRLVELFESERDEPLVVDVHNVIVCMASGETKEESWSLSPMDALNRESVVALQWYKKFAWRVFSDTISAFGLYLCTNNESKLNVDQLLLELNGSFETEEDHLPYSVCYRSKVLVYNSKDSRMPESFPFFLDIVWPVLEDRGWSIVAGNDPSEIIFGPKQKKKEWAGYAKHQRDRQRENDKKILAAMGLSRTRKLSKRLLLKMWESEVTIWGKEPMATGLSGSVDTFSSVKQVLDQFKAKLRGFSSVASQKKVNQIVEEVQKLFNSFACQLSMLLVETNAQPSEHYPAECLLQFLLIVPDILRQSNLPAQDLHNALAVVQDLLDFVAAEHKSMLGNVFHPSPEIYEDDEEEFTSPNFNIMRTKAVLQAHERSTQDGGDGGGSDFGPLVRPHDRERLSDFMVCLLDQALPFHATEEDVVKKKNRIAVGTPGLVCKNCMGAKYEGRYFFSSVESLTASYTCLEKHYLKCVKTPAEVKSAVTKTRADHALQRKHLKSGSQQAYFNELWDRYKGKSVHLPGGAPRSMIVTSQADTPHHESNELFSEETLEEFSDHVCLLDSLHKKEIDDELQGALDRYYACLEYGGRVYMTKEMPDHFSPAWLLAKVNPKDYSDKTNSPESYL